MARQSGLKNVYAAIVTKDDATGTTYGTPTKLERAIKATLKNKSENTKIYSDDSVEAVLNSFDCIEVAIELNQLSLASRAFLQGSKLIKGQLVESKNDIPPVIALGFQSKKADGAARYVWLYKGQFSNADDNYETEEDKKKTQTASLNGMFWARDYDDNYRTFIDSDAANVDTAVITSWFTTVPAIPIGSTTTTMTVVAGMTSIVSGIATTVITCTASKTVAQLKTAIQTDAGKGTFKVWATSAKTTLALDIATVVNTMVVEAIAEDGTTKATYTITVA